MPEIKCLFFDVFGTLVTVDPDPRLANSAAYRTWRAVRSEGIPTKYKDFYESYISERKREAQRLRRTYHELSIHQRIINVLAALGHEANKRDPAVQQAVGAYYKPWFEHTQPRADCSSVLRRLRKQYRIGIVSNFVHPPVFHEILQKLKLRALFDAITVSGEVGYVKPHRRIFERALTSLGSDPGNAVMIGDELIADIQGATMLGMKTILVGNLDGINSRIPTKPTAHVTRLSQLPIAIARLAS